MTYTYDTLNRLESLANAASGGSTIAAFTYTHDKVGNRKTMTDAEGLNSYAYDPTYQLTNVDYPAKPDQHYAYDPVGNRETVTEGAGQTSYTVNNANRYMNVGIVTYGYNSNGCLTRKTDSSGTTYYEYDYENRLKRITYPDSTTSEYTYDYLGRRIKANDKGIIIKYIYDGDRVIAETDNSGNLVCEYVYGNSIDEILYMVKGSNFYYYHYDGLGSVKAITDSSAAIVETYTYDVYGKPTIYNASGIEIPSSQISNRYYFTGREFDFETGLYYYRARYYNCSLGRFMSPDPAGSVNGPNLYTYVSNSPINWFDPWGLAQITVSAVDRGNGSSSTSNYGHGWTTVTNDNGTSTTAGNYPGGPSNTRDVDRPSDASHTWDNITQEQADAATDAMNQPGYNFFNDNCVDRVENALDAAGIDHPNFNTLGISDPAKLTDWLNQLNNESKK